MRFIKKKTRKNRTKKTIKGWNSLRIGLKYALAFTMVVTLFLASTGVSFKLLSNVHENAKVLETNGDLAIQVTELGTLFARKDISVGDYINFKQDRYIGEFDKNSAAFENLKSEIQGRLVNDREKKIFDRINKNDEDMTSIFKEQIIPALKSGDEPKVIMARQKIAILRSATSISLRDLQEAFNKRRHNALENVMDRITETSNILLLSVILSTVVGVLAILLISRKVSRNLKRIVAINKRVAEGDLTVEKMDYQGKDEIGQLSYAINDMLDSLREMIKETLDTSEEISVESGKMSKVSNEVRLGSEQIAATMEQMSAGVQEQASSSMEITHSLADFNTRIQRVNDDGNELNKSSHIILKMSGEGNEQMAFSVNKMLSIDGTVKESVEKINGLEQKTQNISQLVQVINTIAEQTNLLALNAAIEAARAGESGRGFAVVAEEIRKLAEQVGRSVSEITDIVTGIQNEAKSMSQSLDASYKEVKEGTESIKMTGETFTKINDEVKEMADKIQNVSSNLESISENSHSVNQSIEQISAIAEENSAGIEETAASAQQQNSSTETMASNAERLSRLADGLRGMMSRFKY